MDETYNFNMEENNYKEHQILAHDKLSQIEYWIEINKHKIKDCQDTEWHLLKAVKDLRSYLNITHYRLAFVGKLYALREIVQRRIMCLKQMFEIGLIPLKDLKENTYYFGRSECACVAK